MAESVLDQLKKLSDEQAKTAKKLKDLKAKAKIELEEQAKALGYKLVPIGNSNSGVDPDKPCTVCGFQTDPPHDGRKHRHTKGWKNKAFDAEKLKELAYTKLD